MVYLVGAGPGDPGLITVRGLECLRTADVVIHDHLVPSRLLSHARSGAELIDVGIAAPEEMAQEAISLLVAEKARERKVVARLKWGDPFVFDRGGEEALYLHEQRIPFEVVPGIAAGLGVPAYAGVPVTYPGGGDTITLVRGYENESREVPNIDWASLAQLDGTIVCYAGSQQLPRILDALLANGWPRDGRAVVIYNGTMATQDSVTGTLGELLEAVRHHPRRDPAILVVGRVVGLRDHLRWFDARPLFGKRVLVTRPREQADELIDLLTTLGADPVVAPMIRIEPPEDPGPLLRAADNPREFDCIVFASINAVEAFMNALLDGSRDLRALAGPLLCAVGSGTAERLGRYGIRPDLVPQEFRSEALVTALLARGSMHDVRVLLPRSDIGREVVADQLREAGAVVTEVVAYRTVVEEGGRKEDPDVYGMLLQGQIDVVTFTSGSAIRNFVKVYGADQAVDLLRHTIVATIGPVTSDVATQLGVPVAVQPATYTIPAMVDAIAAYVSGATAKSTKTI
jgi:uroporphyrinogen III methyltransferase/synthase